MISKDSTLMEIEIIGAECTKCGSCCRTGSGFAIPVDIPKIAKFLEINEDDLVEKYFDEVDQFNTKLFRPKLKNYPIGECVFLDGNNCTIHAVKPLQCKTGNRGSSSPELRAWFALNYQVNLTDPESVRQWASYLKHCGINIPGGELPKLVPNQDWLNKILKHEV